MTDSEAGFVFVCSACGESLEVNASMRDALIDRGCVICGADVTAEEFTRITSTGPARQGEGG